MTELFLDEKKVKGADRIRTYVVKDVINGRAIIASASGFTRDVSFHDITLV